MQERLWSRLDDVLEAGYLFLVGTVGLVLAWWGVVTLLDTYVANQLTHLVVASVMLLGAWSLLGMVRGRVRSLPPAKRGAAVAGSILLAASFMTATGLTGAPLP